MVAYIASQTISHSEVAAQDEQGISIWDTLSQRTPGRNERPNAPFWHNNEDDCDQPDPDNDDEEEDYDLPAPSRRRLSRNLLDDDDEDQVEDNEPVNTPESSGERAIFITQPDPDEYHEPGTLSSAQKGKTPAARKRRSTTNVWAGFGLSAETTIGRSTTPSAKKRGTTTRGRAARGSKREHVEQLEAHVRRGQTQLHVTFTSTESSIRYIVYLQRRHLPVLVAFLKLDIRQ